MSLKIFLMISLMSMDLLFELKFFHYFCFHNNQNIKSQELTSWKFIFHSYWIESGSHSEAFHSSDSTISQRHCYPVSLGSGEMFSLFTKGYEAEQNKTIDYWTIHEAKSVTHNPIYVLLFRNENFTQLWVIGTMHWGWWW